MRRVVYGYAPSLGMMWYVLYIENRPISHGTGPPSTDSR